MYVSRNGAALVVGEHPAIPKADRMAFHLWDSIAVLALIADVIYAFFGGWYWAVVGVVVLIMVGLSNRKTATQVVMDVANRDPDFRAEMIARGVIVDAQPKAL